MFESGTQIPDTFLGNKFIVPGVYQSTPSDFFVYPQKTIFLSPSRLQPMPMIH